VVVTALVLAMFLPRRRLAASLLQLRAAPVAGSAASHEPAQGSSGPSQKVATVLWADSASEGWKMPASTSR